MKIYNKEVLNFIENPNIGVDTALQIITAYAGKPIFIEITRTIVDKDKNGKLTRTKAKKKNDKKKLIDWFKEYGEIIDNYPDSELPLFV